MSIFSRFWTEPKIEVRQLSPEEITERQLKALDRITPKAITASDTLHTSLSYQMGNLARRRNELEQLIADSQAELADVKLSGDVILSALKQLESRETRLSQDEALERELTEATLADMKELSLV